MEDTLLKPEIKVVDFATDPHINVEVKAFLKIANSGAPIETLPLADARKALVNAQASVKVDLSGIEESEKVIAADGFKLKLNIVRPQGAKGTLPAFIFLHGGGWALGDFPTHKRMVRDLVVLTGYSGVFINYTLSPESQYPQTTDEIYAATKWVAEHGNEIGVDGKNIAIVGNSAGGNMSAVTALKATENNYPKINGLVLMWPTADATSDRDSYHLFGKDRFLTLSLMKWSIDQYVPDLKEREEIYVSPLRATIEQLKGFPPTLIQVAENDILRDEGEAFGRKLNEAGVKVTTVRYNGMIHDFGLLNALAELPTTRSLFLHAAAELKKYLG